MFRKTDKFKLTHALPLLLTLLLAACDSGFKEGAYVDSRSGTTYEFGPDGLGRMLGGVPGAPAFTYRVESDRIIVAYSNSPGAAATFRRIDSKTLERADGAKLVLREQR